MSVTVKPTIKTSSLRFWDYIKSHHMSQLVKLQYLSHRRPAKAQASLRICAVSPEPSLIALIKYGSRRRVRPKISHLAPPDGYTCTFEVWITEDENNHNLMTWLISVCQYKYLSLAFSFSFWPFFCFSALLLASVVSGTSCCFTSVFLSASSLNTCKVPRTASRKPCMIPQQISRNVSVILAHILPAKINIWAASWQNQQNSMARVLSEYSRSAWAFAQSDQTGQMPRLTWVFTGRTCHFVGFVMRQLI